MKTLLLGLLFVTGCKTNAATTQDAGDGGIYGGAGGGNGGWWQRGTPAVNPAAAKAKRRTSCTAMNNGTVTLETNAAIDKTCVTVLGQYTAFVIGVDGQQLSVNIPHVTGQLQPGVAYPLKGNEVVGAFFNKKEADKLAAQTVVMAVYDAKVAKEKGDLGLGHGTVTFRKLPPKGEATPFVADFDIAFESSRIETANNKIHRVKTGVNYYFKGTVAAN